MKEYINNSTMINLTLEKLKGKNAEQKQVNTFIYEKDIYFSESAESQRRREKAPD